MSRAGIVYEEPWKDLVEGTKETSDKGYAIEHRTLIKNRVDSPHLAICMPIGPKDDTIKDGDGNEIQAYRSPGLVPMELMLNQMQLVQPLGVSLTWMMLKNDLSARLRQKMTEHAVDQGVNFIFYWDDDVLIPPNTLYRFLNHMARFPDIGIVTGVYYTKMTPVEPIIYKDAGTGAYWGFDLDPEAPPEDIYSCGAGCMMARVDAIKMMTRDWWDDERVTNADASRQGVVGHDVRFCRNMRDQTGYRVTVDGSVQCHHIDIKDQKIYCIPMERPGRDSARKMADIHSHIDKDMIEKWETPSTHKEVLEEIS